MLLNVFAEMPERKITLLEQTAQTSKCKNLIEVAVDATEGGGGGRGSGGGGGAGWVRCIVERDRVSECKSGEVFRYGEAKFWV
jgi:hypothetical protein